MKKIVILGSTGSIGTSTLDLMKLNPNEFSVLAIACQKSIHKFIEQILKFRPKYAIMEDEILLASVKTKTIHTGVQYISGVNCYRELADISEDFDCLVSAMPGIAGMKPTLELMKKCKTLAIANKESIVCGWKFLQNEAEKYKIKIIPIDSEHDSILQIKQGININDINKITLTGSGGPFFGKSLNDLENVTFSQANLHPNWKMGTKVTIDSATMVNKALELMEACALWGLSYKQVSAIIQRQSIIHAMIEMKDGGVRAFMSSPDMKLHILHAISDKSNLKSGIKPLSLTEIGKLEFFEIPRDIYRSFYLGLYALKHGNIAQIVFNAANEFAVDLFSKSLIKFTDIPKIIEKALEKDFIRNINDIDDVLLIDSEVRNFCANIQL